LEQARQQLRAIALGEYKVAVGNCNRSWRKPRRGWPKEDAAARQELQQLQFQHTEKLNEFPAPRAGPTRIAARLKN
jgi:hypothetical protein